MLSQRLSFCLLTVFLATGLFYLFSYFGPEPSSKVTLLLVLISAIGLRLLITGGRRLKGLLHWRSSSTPQQTFVTEEEEERIHESDHHY